MLSEQDKAKLSLEQKQVLARMLANGIVDRVVREGSNILLGVALTACVTGVVNTVLLAVLLATR